MAGPNGAFISEGTPIVLDEASIIRLPSFSVSALTRFANLNRRGQTGTAAFKTEIVADLS
jgi:hypothetical protein